MRLYLNSFGAANIQCGIWGCEETSAAGTLPVAVRTGHLGEEGPPVRVDRATPMFITRRCACSNQASLSAKGKAARRRSCICSCPSHPFSHWPTSVESDLLDPFMGNSPGVSEALRCPSGPGDGPPKILVRSDRLWNKKPPLCPARFPIAALWSRPL